MIIDWVEWKVIGKGGQAIPIECGMGIATVINKKQRGQ